MDQLASIPADFADHAFSESADESIGFAKTGQPVTIPKSFPRTTFAGQAGDVCLSSRQSVVGSTTACPLISLIRKGPFSTMSVDHVESAVDGV